MQINCLVTHSDWAVMFGNWGFPGVRFILNRCKQSGMKKVYWRVFDGGKAMYHSKIADVEHGLDDVKEAKYIYGHIGGEKWLSYRDWDPLSVAVKYAHEIGLELHAWLQVNEEDHPWGLLSKFAKEHQGFLRKRHDGKTFRSNLSWAYPEVIQYKLSIIEEILEYNVDGIFLDFVRIGGTMFSHVDSKGICLEGYERPIVNAFKKEYGIGRSDIRNNDPEWIKFRAKYITDFLSGVKKTLDKHLKYVPLGVYVPSPGYLSWWVKKLRPKIEYGYGPINDILNGCLIDIEEWTKRKLIDYVCPDLWVKSKGKSAGWIPPSPRYIISTVRYFKDRIKEDCPLYFSFYAWATSPVQIQRGAKAAKKAGVKELILCEAQGIERGTTYRVNLWEEVSKLNKICRKK